MAGDRAQIELGKLQSIAQIAVRGGKPWNLQFHAEVLEKL
jgi:hypothetical protein